MDTWRRRLGSWWGLSRETSPWSDLKARVKALFRRTVESERAWWGSAVETEAVRAAADEGGMDVEQVLDEGSQYTTVYARRRVGAH